jgi:putative ABC transport system permease protein
MSWMNGFVYRLRELLRPGSVDDELQDELHDHLDREARRQAERGTAPDDVTRQAVLRAGHSDLARENASDDRTGRFLADLARDIQYGLRSIRRAPGFAAAVILSLGLGVGGTTAIFSIVNAVLLRPLPFPNSDELYRARIWWGDFSAVLSVADYQALRDTSRGIAEVGAFFYPDSGFAFAGPDGPEVVRGIFVTTELPRVLQVAPVLGPGFSGNPQECQALVGQSFWERRYAARADAIGRPITLDEKPCTIVGVMARGFQVPGQRDDELWVRVALDPPKRRGGYWIHGLVRVPRGSSADQAAARLTALVTPVLHDRYGVKDTWRYGLRSERELIVGDIRETLLMLLSGVGLVLLVAVANVANLLLARGTVRTRELAVRASLGARKGRLARQLLTESALLGLLGGALGLGIAAAALRIAGTSASAIIPRMHEVRLDAVVVLFALILGIGAGVLAGVLPVVRLPWTRLGAWLREGGRATGEGARTGRLRGALVVAEIALTLMVLTGSALLVKSLLRAQYEDPGFRSDGVLTFLLSLPDDPYKDAQRAGAFLTNAETRFRAIPGVVDVAASSSLPPDLLTFSNNYTIEGQTPNSAGRNDVADWNFITPSYLKTLKIDLVAGRQFDGHDLDTSPGVALVNEAFVRHHYPDGRALGKRLKSGEWDPSQPWSTIVGVVRDVPYESGVWGGTQPMVYAPYSQNRWYRSPYFSIRTTGDPSMLVPAIRSALREIDPRLPLRDVITLDDQVRHSTSIPRLRGGLFAALGLFALALAATGVYGVMAYHVSRQKRETAIRRALGASDGQVVGATLGTGLRMIVAGTALGAMAAFATARSLSSMLYRVDPHDPGVIAAAASLVALPAIVACLVPAIRAAQIDPATLLRDE